MALGKLPVFIRSNVKTAPIVFQFQKYSYALRLDCYRHNRYFYLLDLRYCKNGRKYLFFPGFLPFLILNLFYFTKWTLYISPRSLSSLFLSFSTYHFSTIKPSVNLLPSSFYFLTLSGLAMFNIYAKEDILRIFKYYTIFLGSIVLGSR